MILLICFRVQRNEAYVNCDASQAHNYKLDYRNETDITNWGGGGGGGGEGKRNYFQKKKQ